MSKHSPTNATSANPLTVRSCIKLGCDELKALFEQPQALVTQDAAIRRLESEVLLAFVLDKNNSWLYTWPEHEVSARELDEFQRLLAARNTGQPLAYLTGWQEFWSLNFRVTSDVLIPRADTELLVEVALERLQQFKQAARTTPQVLELGTGSGAIAVALAYSVGGSRSGSGSVSVTSSKAPGIAITATDISEDALAIAEQNAQRLLGPACATIEFIQSDWFKQLDMEIYRGYALIVSNPPYIRPDDPHLSTPVTGISFEPQTALVAADNGLQALQTIIADALPRLLEGGCLALEHGHDQAASVRELLLTAGYLSVESRTDLSGVERVTLGMRPRLPMAPQG